MDLAEVLNTELSGKGSRASKLPWSSVELLIMHVTVTESDLAEVGTARVDLALLEMDLAEVRSMEICDRY